MSTPLIRCAGIGRSFDEGTVVDAVRDVSLEIRDGEFVAICGPSGSGKSTLLNLLGLLDSPTSGRFELAGVDVSSIDDVGRTTLRARFFGFVFQAFHLLDHLPVVENVELALLYGGQARRQRRERALEVLDAVGLSHRVDARPATLSGGERQRVAIARALATKPRLLLCDEPTGNLDSTNANQVMALLETLNADGTAVVAVTHDDGIARRAHRRLDMLDGTLVPEAASVR